MTDNTRPVGVKLRKREGASNVLPAHPHSRTGADLIGQECWVAVSCLIHGKVVGYNPTITAYKVLSQIGYESWHHVDSVLLDREAVLKACEENVAYWRDKAAEISRELEEDTHA